MLTGNKDLDLKILGELEDKDLVNICQVNKRADEICKDQSFWLNRIMLKFPYLSLDMLNKYKHDRSWSQYYIEDLRKINLADVNNTLIDSSKNARLDHVIIAINNGANINTKHNLAIRYASSKGHLNIVKYLVSLEKTDIHLNDALKSASYAGNLDMIKYLISQGADVQTQDNYSVKYASKNGHLNVVKYLVSVGANIHVNNNEAVRLANENARFEVIDYLVSLGAPHP